jgi:hypothetical protein
MAIQPDLNVAAENPECDFRLATPGEIRAIHKATYPAVEPQPVRKTFGVRAL